MKRTLAFLLCLLLLPLFAHAETTSADVLALLQSGDSTALIDLMNGDMRAALTPEALEGLLPSLIASFGVILGVGQEESSLLPPYRISRLPVSCEKQGFLLQTVWQEEKLAGLTILPWPEAEVTPVESSLPDGLTEEDVFFGDPPLPGTLTLPAGQHAAPWPAVVLLHGSGPNDRNETVGQTHMFQDLAWGLAQRGIAVLRYDKRTLVEGSRYTETEWKDFTVREEALDDAAAAAKWLSADPRVDRVYLVGHSLGAMLSPRAATEYPDLFSGLILLSGTPRNLGEIILHQNQAVVDQSPDGDKLQPQVDALSQAWDALLACTGEEAREQTIFGQPGYYFWEMAQWDTASLLSALSLPVLIVNGGEDFQVTNEDGILAWQSLDLPENVVLSYHPDLNHLLMAPDAPPSVRHTSAEYQTPCHVPDAIIQLLSEFILK